MPQSATADVNSAVTLYRNNYRAAMKTGQWDDFISCVLGLNGSFPDDLKILFGHQTLADKKYVLCPRCEGAIPYSEATIQTDRRAGLFTSHLAGKYSAEYLTCENVPKNKDLPERPCGKRVYLDTKFDLMSQSPDIYDPKTIIPAPPPTLPAVCQEAMLGWARMITPVIEDRCRRWRMKFSTGSEGTLISTDDDGQEAEAQVAV